MEQSRRSSSRPSRRSHTNLQNLTLAPLSSKYSLPTSPIDNEDYAYTPRSSYIQGKSAPTTPGILSRSNSRHRLGGLSRKYAYEDDAGYVDAGYAYDVAPDYAFTRRMSRAESKMERPEVGSGFIPKAKSSTALLLRQGGLRSGRRPPPPQQKKTLHHLRSGTSSSVRVQASDDDWLIRAGVAIAAGTRESKGQSWLVSRDSSTSLVHPDDDSEDDALQSLSASTQRLHFADDEYSPVSPRVSRWSSRIPSRANSAWNSRRGSKIELLTPVGARTPTNEDVFDPNDDTVLPSEPDFVDVDEALESAVNDEKIVARLAREQSLGLGGWVDRLIGWNLFRVEEDREDTEDEEVVVESQEETRKRRETEALRKREARERLVAPAPANTNMPQRAGTEEDGERDGGGWRDAAWLLSVATKVIL